MEGIVQKSTGSWYTVLCNEGKQIQCKLRGRLKLNDIKSTNPIAVGDYVLLETTANNDTGVITDILERKNYIIRKATKQSSQTHIIAANIDQALLVTTLANPKTSMGFIDRYLVTAEAYSIPACIIFNKYDIYNSKQLKQLEELTNIYEPLGYSCHVTSATKGINVSEIKNILGDKISLLSGLSGTGKSTIINAIDPSLNLKTRPISKTHKKGVHTTTFAEMFQINTGAKIIDTPGIKEFGLVGFESWELSHYFPEMRKLFNQCKFDNCTHIHEPDCKVVEKLENGEIHYSRYLNYIGMLEEKEDHK